MSRRRSLLLNLAVYGLFLVVAVIVTYPLITQMATSFVGFVYGDSYETAHHIWWFTHALQTGQPMFYQTMLGYPNGIDAITVWSNVLQFFPAWLLALVLPLATASNIVVLLTLALNGWAMFVLAKFLIGQWQNTRDEGRGGSETRPYTSQTSPPAPLHVVARGEDQKGQTHRSAPTGTASLAAALIAGLVFMLSPVIQGHLGAGHAGLIVQWPVPLYVLMLLKLRERWSIQLTIAAAIFFFLSAGGHSLQAIYVLLPVTIVYGLLLLARREWAALGRTILAAGLGAVCLGLFLIPVFRSTLGTTAYTEEGGDVRYSADLLAVVTPSFLHPLFGRLTYTHRVLGVNLDEGAAYVGVIAAILSLIAVWKVRASRWWLILALVAWILALGPLLKIFDQPITFTVDGYTSNITLPFALIANLPLIKLARTPGRFDFALALALAVLAGYGAAYLWERVRLNTSIKWTVAAVLMIGIGFEYQTFWPLPTIPATAPQAIADLSKNSSNRAVLDLPWDNLIAAKEGLFLQTVHVLPLIAGQVTRSTPVSPAKLTLLQTTLDPALLRSVGADIVIVHKDQDGDGSLERLAKKQLDKPIYEDDMLAVFATPATDDAPGFMTLPTTQTTLTDQADSYLYAPNDGWVTFSATLTGTKRSVILSLDGVVAQRFTVDGTTAIRLPLPVSAKQFQTVSLALDPACPVHFDAGLVCDSVALSNVSLDYTAAPASAPVVFDHGVTLTRSYVPATASAGDSLDVWLDWLTSAARGENDIRFVHLLDASGKLVAQQDNTLGLIAAGESRSEDVTLTLPPDLLPGAYTVSVGWYVYPAITNFAVVGSGAGSVNVGTVEVK